MAGGTVLTGFSGVPGSAAERLPAGLYLPSTDHVAHVLKATASARPFAGYSPQFFSPDEFRFIRRIIELLLGDIPDGGDVISEIAAWIDLTVYDAAAVREAANNMTAPHRALAIAYYGIGPVRELETSDPQEVCRQGMRALAKHEGASTDEGLRSLMARDVGAQRTGGNDAIAVFLSFLKKRAFEGYYTSRQGLRELDYKGNSFYAEPPGCTHRPGSHGSNTESMSRDGRTR
jgi:hypothetical protein